MRSESKNTFLALTLALLGACTYLTPYKIEIQQGNLLKDDELAQLKVGMSKQQVSQTIGTPLVTDVFHADRWDYVHYVRKRGRMLEQRKVTLVFADDRLAKLEGDGVTPLASEDGASERPAVEPAASEPAPSSGRTARQPAGQSESPAAAPTSTYDPPSEPAGAAPTPQKETK